MLSYQRTCTGSSPIVIVTVVVLTFVNAIVIVTVVKMVNSSLPYMMASLDDRKQTHFTFFLSIFQDFRFYSKF